MKKLAHQIKLAIQAKFNTNHRLVDFIICGTQKGGTTALDSYLRLHPEICMANEKEVHFFDSETNFRSKKTNYSRYHCSFSPMSSHKMIGEATPIYMYWKSAPKRIQQYNSRIKLIVLLRNPIDRAYSHWNMERSRNAENLSFWDAIQQEKQRCEMALPLQHRVYSYVDRGFYLKQLTRLWDHFPKEQTLVLKNEFLRSQPNEALAAVCKFLGIEPMKTVQPQDVFSKPYQSKMTKKERDFLRDTFASDVRGLEAALQWDCSDWLAEEG